MAGYDFLDSEPLGLASHPGYDRDAGLLRTRHDRHIARSMAACSLSTVHGSDTQRASRQGLLRGQIRPTRIGRKRDERFRIRETSQSGHAYDDVEGS